MSALIDPSVPSQTITIEDEATTVESSGPKEMTFKEEKYCDKNLSLGHAIQAILYSFFPFFLFMNNREEGTPTDIPFVFK